MTSPNWSTFITKQTKTVQIGVHLLQSKPKQSKLTQASACACTHIHSRDHVRHFSDQCNIRWQKCSMETGQTYRSDVRYTAIYTTTRALLANTQPPSPSRTHKHALTLLHLFVGFGFKIRTSQTK